jgi:hypothetical protein
MTHALGRARSRTLGLVAVSAALLGLALFGGAPASLFAAPAPPPQFPESDFEIEGPIQAIGVPPGTITVMGVTIEVPEGTPIATPTADGLALADLLGASFLGRSSTGFLGGTGIILGSTNADGTIEAEDVFVEVAENVLLGPLTANTIPSGGNLGAPGTTFAVLGTVVMPTGDPRLPLVKTIEGFNLNLGSVPPGTLVVAEGYFGSDGILYAHTIEAGAGTVVGPANQTSITRAICQPGGRLEVRGASTTASVVTLLGRTQTAVLDPETGLASFRFRIPTGQVGGCPSTVTVTNSNGSSATASVEIL